eukprot:symbB.v1.2.041535.t1/scaffold8323.1/size6816/2
MKPQGNWLYKQSHSVEKDCRRFSLARCCAHVRWRLPFSDGRMQGLDFASPGGASPSQASQCTPVPVKIDARELGERLAADAWASADRLLMCLCLRAWRLQRHGRVAVKSPTPPVQFQGAKAPRPGRSWCS